ncbi:MAG: hypothetical protein F6J93_27790 [Oscillatoria sp. SIO1A7]|nr:hypothetical protein [Oscillatoria sp. SIO1A7]
MELKFNHNLFFGTEEDGIAKIGVEKTGTGVVEATVSLSAASTKTSSKYLNRALKAKADSGGDFYTSKLTLSWGKDEQGVKYAGVPVFSDNSAERAEKVRLSLKGSSPAGAVSVLGSEAELFILDGDGTGFMGRFVPSGTEINFDPAKPSYPVGSTRVEVGQFEIAIGEPNTQDWEYNPTRQQRSRRSGNPYDAATKNARFQKNFLNYQKVGSVVNFFGEVHVENLRFPTFKEIRDYNQMEGESLSEYGVLLLKLPFKNLAGSSNTKIGSPLLVTGQVGGQIRNVDETNLDKVNAGLSAIALPDSDLVFLEYANKAWKTELSGAAGGSVWFHLFVQGSIVVEAAN